MSKSAKKTQRVLIGDMLYDCAPKGRSHGDQPPAEQCCKIVDDVIYGEVGDKTLRLVLTGSKNSCDLQAKLVREIVSGIGKTAKIRRSGIRMTITASSKQALAKIVKVVPDKLKKAGLGFAFRQSF